MTHQIIPEGGFVLLYAPYGIGKSFLAMDLAHCVGSGKRWLNRRTMQGRVLYVAAGEGVPGLRMRLEAWEDSYGAISDVGYVTEAPQLHHNESAGKLIALVKRVNPTLVILDTLARCFVGGNENSGEDMGKIVGTVDRMREGGATVLLVHHSGRPNEDGHIHERGHTSVPSAADTILELREGDTKLDRVLVCQKQKYDEAFYPIHFSFVKVGKALVVEV